MFILIYSSSFLILLLLVNMFFYDTTSQRIVLSIVAKILRNLLANKKLKQVHWICSFWRKIFEYHFEKFIIFHYYSIIQIHFWMMAKMFRRCIYVAKKSKVGIEIYIYLVSLKVRLCYESPTLLITINM